MKRGTGTAPMEDSGGRDNMYGSWGMILYKR